MTTSCRWENWFERVSASIRVLVLLDGKGRQERNSLRVEAHVLQRASRHVKEPHSSSSSGPVVEAPAVERVAEAGTTPAPVLKTWSSIKNCIPRLRELGAPIYGTKDVLFRRLCEYEQIAARRRWKRSIWNRGGRSWRWLQNR